MPPSFFSTPVARLIVAPPEAVESDVLAVPVFTDDRDREIVDLPDVLAQEIRALLAAGEFKAEPCDIMWTRVQDWRTPRVLLVGAGERDEATPRLVRRLATAAGLATRARRQSRVVLLLRDTLPAEPYAGVAIEGLTLAAFNVDAYRSTPSKLAVLEEIGVTATGGSAETLADAVERGRVLGEATNIARGLAHEPPNVLTPAALAERMRALLTEAGIEVDVLDDPGGDIARLIAEPLCQG